MVCGEAEDYSMAWNEIQKLEPDMVLVDISLKGRDGISLVKEISRHYRNTPTLVVSMHDETRFAERSLLAGAKDVQFKRPLQIITAGAPPAPTVIKNMESLGINVTQVYGLTEVFGPHSICEWQTKWDGLDLEERSKIKARQGVPYVHALHMDVVDADTMMATPRDGKTIGEIVMQGNNVMLGYYKDPKSTDDAFRGGWFHSGDLAVMHPDNYIQIMDRKKDIINYCKQHLARFKAPKAVEFGELPKTATGKVQKFKLKNKEWAGRERRVN